MTTPKDGEIYGLNASSNRRSCEQHQVCGKEIFPNDLVRFKFSVLEFNGEIERAIKVVQVRDGTEMCTVGYLPRHIIHRKDRVEGKFSRIIELYSESEKSMMRKKDKLKHGVASYRFLSDIQEQV